MKPLLFLIAFLAVVAIAQERVLVDLTDASVLASKSNTITANTNPKRWLGKLVDPQPAFDPATQYLVSSRAVDGDNLRTTWTVVNYTQEELDAIAAAEADQTERGRKRQIFADNEALLEAALADLENGNPNTWDNFVAGRRRNIIMALIAERLSEF